MKHRTRIIYHERLGDVVRCLPLARHLALKGAEVEFECNPEYHDIFKLVSYAKPVRPGTPEDGCEIVQLQIWPRRFEDFEARGLNWMDYAYEPWPECGREIVFDRLDILDAIAVPDWVRESALVFPNGYSQRNPPDARWVILMAHRLFMGAPVCVIGKQDLGCHQLNGILELVAYIRAAKRVLTVNTAPSIIASAVRSCWHHVPDLDPRHDWQHKRQIPVPRPLLTKAA